MPDSSNTVVATLEQHKNQLADHEARIRHQERWSVDHDARDSAGHAAMQAAIERLADVQHRQTDKQDKQHERTSEAFAEIGRLKLKMSLVMALAGGLGGIVSSVVISLILWALGVLG